MRFLCLKEDISQILMLENIFWLSDDGMLRSSIWRLNFFFSHVNYSYKRMKGWINPAKKGFKWQGALDILNLNLPSLEQVTVYED